MYAHVHVTCTVRVQYMYVECTVYGVREHYDRHAYFFLPIERGGGRF